MSSLNPELKERPVETFLYRQAKLEESNSYSVWLALFCGLWIGFAVGVLWKFIIGWIF